MDEALGSFELISDATAGAFTCNDFALEYRRIDGIDTPTVVGPLVCEGKNAHEFVAWLQARASEPAAMQLILDSLYDQGV